MFFAASSSSGGSPLSFILLLALPVALYFMMIRPQKRKALAQQQLTKSIGEGDEVMTTSGVYGFVTAIEDDIVWLEIAEGVDIRVTRSAVAKRVTVAAVLTEPVTEPVTEPAADDTVTATPDAAN